MFNNIQMICIETFLLTLHSRLKTANVYCDVTQNRKMKSAVKLIVCEIRMNQQRYRIKIDGNFLIVIINFIITHRILH